LITKSGKEFHNLIVEGKELRICISFGCQLNKFHVVSMSRGWRFENMIMWDSNEVVYDLEKHCGLGNLSFAPRSKLFSIDVTFEVLEKSLYTNLADWRCTTLSLLISQCKCGDQTVEANSNIDLTYR